MQADASAESLVPHRPQSSTFLDMVPACALQIRQLEALM